MISSECHPRGEHVGKRERRHTRWSRRSWMRIACSRRINSCLHLGLHLSRLQVWHFRLLHHLSRPRICMGPRWTSGVVVPSDASESWRSYLGINLAGVWAAQDKGDGRRRATRYKGDDGPRTTQDKGYDRETIHIRFRMHQFLRGY
jgi:hypothetical protein